MSTKINCSKYWYIQSSLKLVDKFTYLGSSVSSIETVMNTQLAKAWAAIDRLSFIWKSDLTDEIKRSFFQAAIVSILLYGRITWNLTKRMEKRLDTRMLWAILNKSWRQHPTKQHLCSHSPPITKTIQVRRTRHAGHCWRIKEELISDVLQSTPSHGRSKAGRPSRPFIQQIYVLKARRMQWTIENGGEKGSGISVLMARHDDDFMYITDNSISHFSTHS